MYSTANAVLISGTTSRAREYITLALKCEIVKINHFDLFRGRVENPSQTFRDVRIFRRFLPIVNVQMNALFKFPRDRARSPPNRDLNDKTTVYFSGGYPVFY